MDVVGSGQQFPHFVRDDSISYRSMKPTDPCAVCGCGHRQGAAAHAIAAAVAADDIDQAIELGLLDHAACANCAPQCAERVRHARDARLSALAARERYRARQARLQRRAEALLAKRSAAAPETTAKAAGLPTAAAAALDRAKARAAGRETK